MLRRLTAVLVTFSIYLSPANAVARSKRSHKAEPSAKSASTPSAQALEEAHQKWDALKADPRRSKYRSNWLKVAAQLESVAKRFPKSPQAPKALFDAGEMFEDLSRISWLADDIDSAVQLYTRLDEQYPDSPMVSESHLALARIYLNRKNDDDRARTELSAVIKAHHKGEALTQARQLLAGLSKAEAKGSSAKATESKGSDARSESKAVEAKPEGKRRHKKKAAAAPDAELAHVDLPSPIVPPETIDGVGEGDAGAPEHASPASEPSEPAAKLYAATEIIPQRSEHERLDKDKLAALKSAVRTSGDLPLSAQMGLKVRRVVIDAGHGGHDTGAIGPSGVKEKDVSLAVAKKLADKLKAQGLEVLLTRSDDRFVPLEGRTAFANENRADLFISVHCNASTSPKLHGVETYSLNVSSNQYGMRLAARENASSERSLSDLEFMLADLTTKANTADSRQLARAVQSSVVSGLRGRDETVRDLGPKEALFYVLLGTRMPAILVEGSFISNPEEEKRLADPAFQDRLASSIAAGVERFIGERQSLAGVPVAGLP